MNDNLRIAFAQMGGGEGSLQDQRSVRARIGDYDFLPFMGRVTPVCSGRARVGPDVVPGDLDPRPRRMPDPLAVLAAAAEAYAQTHRKEMDKARAWASSLAS